MSQADDRSTRGAKRARLLEEAAKALNSRGISQTSLSEIAQSVGVSRAALYYYFEDQEDLVFQSYRRSCEMMARRLSEASHAGGDAMSVLTAFVDGMLAEDEPEFASLSEAAYLRPEQRSTILGLYEALLAGIAEILNEGARRGELRPCSAGIVGQSIIGLVSWIPMARRWRSSQALSHRDMVEAIKALLDHGVAAKRRPPIDFRPFDFSSGDVRLDRVFDAEALAAAKQQALLASASWLFNLKGVDATSLEEIATRVGVTKKVIYHNVGDKETLVVECYRRSFRMWEEIARWALSYDGSRLEAFYAAMRAAAEASLREDLATLSPLAGFEALPDAAQDEINAAAVRLMDAHLEMFAVGQAQGSMSAANPRAILAIAPGVYQWLPKWFDTFSPGERAGAAQEVADLLALGLRPL
jgi:AcrR family transcriptional regulator